MTMKNEIDHLSRKIIFAGCSKDLTGEAPNAIAQSASANPLRLALGLLANSTLKRDD
jgi:hypothetical protein